MKKCMIVLLIPLFFNIGACKQGTIKGSNSEMGSGADSVLDKSIRSTTPDKTGSIAPQYDDIQLVKASDILTTELLKGPHHKVFEDVFLRGPEYFFTVESDFGNFNAQGMARLRRLIREINAISAMKKVTNTHSFEESFKDSALSPIYALKDLAYHPVDTVSGVPKGLWSFVTSTEENVSRGRSQYEDSYVKALVTVSKYKRKYAAQMKIDVYSSNPEVQKELNRLGWAAAIANWTPSVILLPVSGPGKVLYEAFDWTDTLNDLITEKAPDELRHINDEKLKAMGISPELRDRFLSHKYYSPRNQTVITHLLETMEGAKGKEAVLEQAINADSEVDAFTYQQIIEILAGYQRSVSTIAELIVYRGIPTAYANNRSLVMGYPVDLGRWTPFSESLFTGFAEKSISSKKIASRELWILGALTPKARQEFKKLDITVIENANRRVGMMD